MKLTEGTSSRQHPGTMWHKTGRPRRVRCTVKSDPIQTNPGKEGVLKEPLGMLTEVLLRPRWWAVGCSEGAESKEARRQSQTMTHECRRGQSLKGEVPRPVTPRPCHVMTSSPRLCTSCGRRQSQAPPCMRRLVGNEPPVRFKQVWLPTPPRKSCSPRLQKQNSTVGQPTYAQIPNHTTQNACSTPSQSNKKDAKTEASTQFEKPNNDLTTHKAQHTQTRVKTESTAQHASQHTKDKCATTQTNKSATSKPLAVSPKPRPLLHPRKP